MVMLLMSERGKNKNRGLYMQTCQKALNTNKTLLLILFITKLHLRARNPRDNTNGTNIGNPTIHPHTCMEGVRIYQIIHDVFL